MTRITPDCLCAGMVLASDVEDGQGLPWLPRGRVLSQADILALSTMGRDAVEIADTASATSSVIEDKALMHARHEMDEAFRFAGTAHPMMMELHRLCMHRRARRLADFLR